MVFYCCIINHPKPWQFKAPTLLFLSWLDSLRSGGRQSAQLRVSYRVSAMRQVMGKSSGETRPLPPSLCTGLQGLSCPPGLSSQGVGRFTWQLSASKSMPSKRENTEAFRLQCLDSRPKDITSVPSSLVYGKVVPSPAHIQGVKTKEQPRQTLEASATALRAHDPQSALLNAGHTEHSR